MADVGLWPLGPEDLPEVQALVAESGRNLHREEFDRFRKLEGAGGYVMRTPDGLVGAITTMRCFEHAILGPIIASEKLSTGLALTLVQQAIERLQRAGVERVESEASDAEAQLLLSIGFTKIRTTLVLERPPTAALKPGGATPFASRHLLYVGSLDAAAVGYGRKEYLAVLAEERPDSAFVSETDSGEVDGFAFLRRSKRGYHFGPLVTTAGGIDIAKRLVEQAVAAHATWPIVALVPEGSDLLAALESAGFAEVGRLQRLGAGEAAPTREADEWLVGGRLTG